MSQVTLTFIKVNNLSMNKVTQDTGAPCKTINDNTDTFGDIVVLIMFSITIEFRKHNTC